MRLRAGHAFVCSDRALDHYAEGAGAALACSFSTSDEYYADIIARQRAAGVYGPSRHRVPAAIACAIVVLIAAILVLA